MPPSTPKILPPPTVVSGALQSHAVRVLPGVDLVQALLDAAKQAMEASNSQSAFVMTSVGSLSEVTLRMAATSNEPKAIADGAKSDKLDMQRMGHRSLAEATSLQIENFNKHFEIVSLVGTFSSEGGKHLHICVADSEGKVVGGHLISGTVFTTLELVLGTIAGVTFSRELDAQTGYNELLVRPDATSY